MNPIAFVFGTFVIYVVAKGRFPYYWRLVTTQGNLPANANTVNSNVVSMKPLSFDNSIIWPVG